MDPLVISLVSAATALVASIAGPIVTLTVAKRQFNANVLSANRQKWIETLRDGLAELISLLATALVVKQNWKGSWDKGKGVIEAEPQCWSAKVTELSWPMAARMLSARPKPSPG